jgi:DNA-binding transcriptional ArsR family regulator
VTDPIKSARTQEQEEALLYALGHRIRIEIHCLLNEGIYSAVELTARMPWSLPVVSYHVTELRKKGSIEIAHVKKVRNVDQHFYRAVELPEIDDAEAAKLPPEVKQEYAAVILQAVLSECLNAFRAEKLTEPNVRMMWSWFSLDEEGRQELADEQRESWERINEIEARSINRQAESGEQGTSMIAVTLGFERSKMGGSTPPSTHRLAPNKAGPD